MIVKTRKGNYIFTNKKHPQKGIMSTVLGIISVVSVLAAVYVTFQNHGIAQTNYGVAVLLSLVISLIGVVLGILSRMEVDKFYLFSYIGMLLNGITLVGIGFIVYFGIYGVGILG